MELQTMSHEHQMELQVVLKGFQRAYNSIRRENLYAIMKIFWNIIGTPLA